MEKEKLKYILEEELQELVHLAADNVKSNQKFEEKLCATVDKIVNMCMNCKYRKDNQ